MTALTALGTLIVGPLLIGLVLVYLLHVSAGWLANKTANGSDQKLQQNARTYIEIVTKLRDTLFIWAVGVIVFMAIGWI